MKGKDTINLDSDRGLLEERLWLDAKIREFDDILRLNYNKNVEEFSDTIIYHLSKISGAIRGAFFVVNHEEKTARATGGYACTLESIPKPEFMIGEGIIGQAVKMKEIMHIANIPPQNVQVETSLGKLSVSDLVAVPLIFNDTVYGAVELVYFNGFSEKNLSLFERLARNVASMLESIQKNIKTKQLLELSRTQSQEMSAQEEELRQNMEEMQATQELLQRQMREAEEVKTEMAVRINLLDKTALLLEMDIKGNIIYTNRRFNEVTKYQKEEILGSSFEIIVHPDSRGEKFAQVWSSLNNSGKFQGKCHAVSQAGGAFWVEANIASVQNKEGFTEKYIAILFDITEQVDRQENMRQLLELSQKQKASLEDKETELLESMHMMESVAENMLQKEEALLGQIEALRASLEKSKTTDAKAAASEKLGFTCALNESLDVMVVGDRLSKWLGHLPGAINTKPFVSLLMSGEDAFKKAVKECLQGKGAKEFKFAFRHKQGQPLEALAACSAAKSGSGHDIYFLAVYPQLT